MPARPLSLAPFLLAAALAGCTGATPADSIVPSAVAVAPGSAAASPSPSAAPASPVASPGAAASLAAASPSPSASPKGAGGIHGEHATVEVTMVDFAFEPAAIEVAEGQTVRWTNEGGQPHSVKTDDDSISSPIVLAEPFAWTAEGAPGAVIEYFCGIHPSMTGTITIAG